MSENNKCSRMKSILFIVNPVSGKKSIQKEMGGVLSAFNHAGFLPSVYYTQKRGDATEIAATCGNGYDIICCAGGDGTLNEVVTGLMESNATAKVSYIPCGSTNDFAVSRGLTADALKEAERIVSKTDACTYDLGKFENRFFTYAAAFGAFSQVSYGTDQNLKNILGHSAYLLNGVKDLNKIKPVHAIIRSHDTVIEDDFLFGSITNSTSLGGTISFPNDLVDTSDGKFEVLLIRMPNSLISFNEIIMSLISQKYDSPHITFLQTDELTVKTNVPYAWTLDGEASGECEEAHICVLQKALELIG